MPRKRVAAYKATFISVMDAVPQALSWKNSNKTLANSWVRHKEIIAPTSLAKDFNSCSSNW